MKIKPFELERYFAKYEFSTPYLLSCSDCEPLPMSDLLSMSDNESLKLWNNLKLAYTESQGHPILREEIAKLYSTIKPEETIVLVPEEGIFIAMNIILDAGDHVITTFPGYQSLYELAVSQKCEVSKWAPSENGKFELEVLFEQVKPNTKLIVINFPHNPTGATISKEEQKKIMVFSRERNIYIFSDEMYQFLEYDENDRLPSACDLYENAISLFGMSKSYALPGLRIGWLATKNKNLLKEIINFKDYTSICSSAPSEILAIIGLKNAKTIISKNLEIINANLQIIYNFIGKHKNFISLNKPRAGTICFPEILINEPIDEFCKQLLEQKGVMLLPSSVYTYNKKCVRLGFGRKNMPEALEKFSDFLIEKY